MFRTSQRCRRRAVTLARFVLLSATVFLAGCTDSGEPPASEANEATTTTSPPLDSNELATTTTSLQTNDATIEELQNIGADLPGKIVHRTIGGSILVSSPDGSETELWHSLADGQASQPTWSRDGSQLVWSKIDRTGVALVIATMADGPTEVVSIPVPSPAFYYSWSPEAQWLAALRNGPEGGLEVAMVDPATQDIRVVGRGQPFYTDWATNQDLVAAVAGSTLIDIPAADGTPASQRELDSPLGVFQTPVSLPNGDVIVMLQRGSFNDVVRLTGTTATTLARTDTPVALSTDPLGERLAVLVGSGANDPEFISFQNTPEDAHTLDSGRVSIIDLRTGQIETRPETNIVAINWSPTGEKLAMLEIGNTTMTWIFTEPTGAPQRSEPFVPSVEFTTSYLPFADQYDRSSTWWSPDGKAFVFAGQRADKDGVWIDHLEDDKGPAYLGEGDIAFWSR